MTIEQIQHEFMAAGFQWTEHIYNDGYANCSIQFTRETPPQSLSTYPRPADCVGWGRFDRMYAWQQAHDWLVKEGRPV